ncbi:RNA dependent RNA polymerase-domain-containing protein [Xylariaceae sp. FL1651]|nr:RNA dependent RNA polymerase-domain-containing protein [Xylariaceae sp. FL1651]
MNNQSPSTSNGFHPKGMEVRLTGVPKEWNDIVLKIHLKQPLAEFSSQRLPSHPFNYDVLVILDKSSEDLKWDAWDGISGPNAARLVVPDFELGKQLVLAESLQVNGIKIGVTEIRLQDTDDAKYEELRKGEYKIPKDSAALENGYLAQIISIKCGNFNGEGDFETAYTWPTPPSDFNIMSWFGDQWPKKIQACISAKGPVGRSADWSGEWMDISLPNVSGMIFGSASGETQELYIVVNKPPQFYRRSLGSSGRGSADNNLPSGAVVPDGFITTLLVREKGHRIPFPEMEQLAPEVCGIPWPIQFSRVYRFEISKIQPKFDKLSIMNEISLSAQYTAYIFDCSTIRPTDGRQNTATAIKEAVQKIDAYALQCRLGLYMLLYNCNIQPSDMGLVDSALGKLGKDFRDTPTVQDTNFLHTLLAFGAEKMGTSQLRELKRIYHGTDSGARDDARTVIVEPLTALRGSNDALKSYHKDETTVFNLLIFPSHIEIQGPRDVPFNSVTAEFRNEAWRLLGVRFAENDESRLRIKQGINPDTIISERVYNTLKAPLNLAGQCFDFLGYSNSSLKNTNQVWFFSQESGGSKIANAKAIRDWIGDWEKSEGLARNPPKWGARIGQAFSTSKDAEILISPDKWKIQPDSFNNPPAGTRLPYTDGCGFISKKLSDRINLALGLNEAKRSTAFQIRFGGAKGVVYEAPEVLFALPENSGLDMVLRNSLVKYHVLAERTRANIPLRIVSVAEDYHTAAFNKPLLKALEDIGVAKKKILDIYTKSFENLAQITGTSLNILRSTTDPAIEWSGKPILGYDVLLKLCFTLSDRGITPDMYGGAFLKMFLAKLLEHRRIEDLFKVPIPGSHTALGLTDDCQILGPEEVYLRATGKTVTGRVLIYRNPIIHIGDIQWATALSDQQVEERIKNLQVSEKIKNYIKTLGEPEKHAAMENLLHSIKGMDNVIFFSQKDPRPLPNMLSGGDLDGDKYHVLPESSGLIETGIVTQDAAIYDPEEPPKPSDSAWSMDALSQFVGSFIRNDCLGLLSHTLLIISDWLPEGLKAKECKDLAVHISRAVDFQKTGVPVDFQKLVDGNDAFKTGSKPDFYRAVTARAYYDKRGEFYTSNKLLGEIYRLGKASVTFPEFAIDDSALAGLVEQDCKKLFSPGKARREMKVRLYQLIKYAFDDYRTRLKSQLLKSREKTEFALLLPSWEHRNRFDIGNDIKVIEGLVTDVLAEFQLIARNFSAQKWRLVGNTSLEDVQSIYQELLFEAWVYSLDLSKGQGSVSFPSSPWAMVTCDDRQSVFDSSPCNASDEHGRLTLDGAEAFWTNELPKADCSISPLETNCSMIKCSNHETSSIELLTYIFIGADGGMSCLHDGWAEARRDLAAIPQDDVVRVVLSNETASGLSTPTSSNITAATTSTGPSNSSCSGVPTRAFRPPGSNGSVCDYIPNGLKPSSAGSTICKTILMKLLMALVVYLLYQIMSDFDLFKELLVWIVAYLLVAYSGLIRIDVWGYGRNNSKE